MTGVPSLYENKHTHQKQLQIEIDRASQIELSPVPGPHGADGRHRPTASGCRRVMRSVSLVARGSLRSVACGPSSGGASCKDTIVAGDLVITEVFADFKAPTGGTGTDAGKEWFEIYNATDRPIELEGLTLTHSRPDGSKREVARDGARSRSRPASTSRSATRRTDLVPAVRRLRLRRRPRRSLQHRRRQARARVRRHRDRRGAATTASRPATRAS